MKIGKTKRPANIISIPRRPFYGWMKWGWLQFAEQGMIKKKPCRKRATDRVSKEVEEEIIYASRIYHLGQL